MKASLGRWAIQLATDGASDSVEHLADTLSQAMRAMSRGLYRKCIAVLARPAVGSPDYPSSGRLHVKRATDRQAAAVEDVGIDHRRFDIFVAEQFLHCSDVVAGFKQVGRKGMPERVRPDRFGKTRTSGGNGDDFLQTTVTGMVTSRRTRLRIDGQAAGGKHVLPTPGFSGVGIFAIKGGGQIDRAVARCKVLRMRAV